jgi:CBS domain-containing protein
MQISELLEKQGGALFTIGPDRTVADLIEALNERHVGALVVVDDRGRFLGLASERLVLRAAYDGARRAVDTQKLVRDVMRPRETVPSVQTAAHLRDAVRLMQSARSRHVVVVDDDDRAVACVSVRDVIELLLEAAEKENSALQNFMYGY